MWWLIALVLATPAAAQRPFCDYGEGVNALRAAQQALAAPVTGLVAGREAALAIAAGLETARAAFARCGCPRLAGMLPEPVRMAEGAASHNAASAIRASFDQTAVHAGLAREALERDGCR